MSLTGDVREQVFVMFNGEGGNGKSVLVDLILWMMGEYASMAPASLVVETGRSEHPTEIADLMGRRLVIASESNKDVNLREDQVKRLTGDRRLKGRLMRGDFFEFDRTHKLVSLVNRLPRVRENSHAMWRRIFVVPFSVVIAEDKKDTGLLDSLRHEGAGILNWLIAGCLAWQKGGLAPPEAVQVATRGYRQREDSFGHFLSDRCELEPIEPGGRAEWFTPWRDIRAAYEAWCASRDRRPESDSVLQDALERKGLMTTTKRVGGVPTKGRLGIALREPEFIDGVTA